RSSAKPNTARCNAPCRHRLTGDFAAASPSAAHAQQRTAAEYPPFSTSGNGAPFYPVEELWRLLDYTVNVIIETDACGRVHGACVVLGRAGAQPAGQRRAAALCGRQRAVRAGSGGLPAFAGTAARKPHHAAAAAGGCARALTASRRDRRCLQGVDGAVLAARRGGRRAVSLPPFLRAPRRLPRWPAPRTSSESP